MPRLFLVLLLFLSANESPEKAKTYTVYINYPDYSVRANVLQDAGKLHPKTGCMYYWYSNNDIKKTDGGFDGKLLHGEYKSFYKNMNLREQGNFSRGLKDGKWISWHLNGHVYEIRHYKNGSQQGIAESYDKNGTLVSRSHYKNDQLNGKKILYSGGKTDTVISYKNGVPALVKKPKTPREKKIKNNKNDSLFKQQKDTASHRAKSSILTKKLFNKNDSARSPEKEKKKAPAGKEKAPEKTTKPSPSR